MDPYPYCVTVCKFRRFLSHQRHIAYYLASIFGSNCLVGYYGVVWDDDPNRTVLERAYVEVTLREYLVHSERGHGFLIEEGDLYHVVYNDCRRQLVVNGFWIDCDRAEVDPC